MRRTKAWIASGLLAVTLTLAGCGTALNSGNSNDATGSGTVQGTNNETGPQAQNEGGQSGGGSGTVPENANSDTSPGRTTGGEVQGTGNVSSTLTVTGSTLQQQPTTQP